MPRGKKTFFERLTGAINADEEFDLDTTEENSPREKDDNWEEDPEDAQLTVDMYQTPNDIIIRTIVAGVKPEDLDVTITREMVTIRGTRDERRETTGDDYFHQELYWGSFSRTILLPEEVDVEAAEAEERHGLLTIRLPKIDKKKQTQLKVKGK